MPKAKQDQNLHGRAIQINLIKWKWKCLIVLPLYVIMSDANFNFRYMYARRLLATWLAATTFLEWCELMPPRRPLTTCYGLSIDRHVQSSKFRGWFRKWFLGITLEFWNIKKNQLWLHDRNLFIQRKPAWSVMHKIWKEPRNSASYWSY